MSVLFKVPGRANLGLFRVVDRLLEEGEELVVLVWEDVRGDRVNCELYRGWRQGKRQPGVRPGGVGLVEASGESIEIGGVRRGGSVRVRAGKGDSSAVVDLDYEPFGEEA